MGGFEFGDGMGLLGSAGEEAPEEYGFSVSGDLNQMAEQKRFLLSHGFDIRQNDVYPSIKGSDKKRALELIWNHRVAGWWHYDEKYYDLKICTKEEFDKALDIQCNLSKY